MTGQAGPLSPLALAGGWGVGSLARQPRLVLRWSRSPGPARHGARLATTSANIRTEVADAADATAAWSLLDQYEKVRRPGSSTMTDTRTELWTEMRGIGMREWRGCANHWEGAP